MKNLYGQYPDIYSKDDTRYTYYFDNGTRVTLIAGEDGVTEDWIHALKLEHRKEYNMLRQGQKRKSAVGEDSPLRLVSLDCYMEEVGDAGQALEDPTADIEENYIAGVERTERREAIERILGALSSEQQKLLIRVRVQGISQSQIAEESGVSKMAICQRMKKIDEKLKNIRGGGLL